MTRPDDVVVETVELRAGSFAFTARVAGPDDGRVVLLLHGFPETSYSFRSQVAALGGAGYRAVAPDQRGYSAGARPADEGAYAIEHLGADVLALADELGAHRFDVVGHDWGAAVAWYVAGRWPARVRTLTAVSVPHPSAMAAALRGELGGDQAQRSWYMDFFRQPGGVAEDALLGNDVGGLRNIWSSLPADAVDEYVRVLGERAALTAALSYYRANRLDGGVDVPPIDVPTLFVWSTDDVALGREGAEATAGYVAGPYRFEVLEGVDHWIPENAADRLSGLLLEHLAAHRD
jgi:pimeloyl-ACP methyl ester carboxylesterase